MSNELDVVAGMIELKRITTQYDEHQDRICVCGEGRDGQPAQVLWLTQRLLNRLIGPLCSWLDTKVGGNEHLQPSSVRQTLMNTFAQQHAVQSMVPTAAVAVDASNSGDLVQSVDLQCSANAVRLIFNSPGHAGQAVLTMKAPLLRQWLYILYGQYRKARWPASAWPEWIEASGSSGQTKNAMILH